MSGSKEFSFFRSTDKALITVKKDGRFSLHYFTNKVQHYGWSYRPSAKLRFLFSAHNTQKSGEENLNNQTARFNQEVKEKDNEKHKAS
jgi:hypothetical protein